MNGGEEERAELNKIKDAVKKNNKRKRTEMSRSKTEEDQKKSQRTSVVNDEIQPIDPKHDWNDGRSEVQESTHEFLEGETPLMTPDESSKQTLSTTPTPSGTRLLFGHDREFELLMHYLDHVFALQFRFHSPSVASGGRGWLLWLLNDTLPLRHAG